MFRWTVRAAFIQSQSPGSGWPPELGGFYLEKPWFFKLETSKNQVFPFGDLKNHAFLCGDFQNHVFPFGDNENIAFPGGDLKKHVFSIWRP